MTISAAIIQQNLTPIVQPSFMDGPKFHQTIDILKTQA
jgi:hypothetical protein